MFPSVPSISGEYHLFEINHVYFPNTAKAFQVCFRVLLMVIENVIGSVIRMTPSVSDNPNVSGERGLQLI